VARCPFIPHVELRLEKGPRKGSTWSSRDMLFIFQLRDLAVLATVISSLEAFWFVGMQALHDPTRKTSINSLLNPEDSAAFPVALTPMHPNAADANQGHSHLHSSIHSGHLFPPSDGTFSLRTATWDESDTRASAIIPDHQRHHPHHHQQQLQMTPQMSNAFADHHAPRPPMRSDRLDDRFVDNGHRWPNQQHSTNNGVFAPPYPNERNGKCQKCRPKTPLTRYSSFLRVYIAQSCDYHRLQRQSFSWK